VRALRDPGPEHRAGELGRDDGDGHVVAAFVGEPLRVAGDVRGRRDRARAERGARLVVEVGEVLVREGRPVRQRDRAARGRVPVGDGSAIARGEAADVDDTGDPVGPRVDRGMGDRGAGGVPDEHDLAVGRGDGVDGRADRVDVVAQGDPRAVGVRGLHTGQRERVGAVTRLLEDGNDLLPRRSVEPEAGNQDDVHARGVPPGVMRVG